MAIYGTGQDIHTGDHENPADPHLTVRLYLFTSDDAAADWLDNVAYDRFAEEGYANTLKPIDVAFNAADAAIAAEYTAEYGGADLEGTVVWVLVDDTVARLTLGGAEPIDLDAIEELVGAQVDCLLGSPCESVALPTELT